MKNKDFIFILIGRILQIIVSVSSLKLLTHYLNKEQVGLFFIFTAILTYFGYALISPIGHYCNRQFHGWIKKGVLLNRLSFYFIYVVTIVTLCIVIAYLFREKFLQYFNYSQMVFFVFMGVVSNTTVTAFIPFLNMIEKRGTFVALTCLNILFGLIFSLISIFYFTPTALNWFWGQFISQIIFTIISFIIFKSYIKENFEKPVLSDLNKVSLKKVWDFANPIALSALFLWFILDGYRYILEFRFGLEFVAEISVGFAIAQRVSFALESIIQQLYLPSFYKISGTGEKEKTKEALELLVSSAHPFYFVSTCFVIFLSPFMVRLLATENYNNAYIFVMAGAVFHFFRKYTAMATLGAHGIYDTKLAVIPHAITAVILFLCLSFIPAQFAHYLVSASLVICSLILFILLNHRISQRVGFSIFNEMKKIDFLMCSGAGSVLAIFFWKSSSSLLYSAINFLFFGIVVAFYFYKKILSSKRSFQ